MGVRLEGSCGKLSGIHSSYKSQHVIVYIRYMVYLQRKYAEVEMLRKVFRTGNSIVVSIPREALEFLDIREGEKIEVNLDRENRQMIIKPVEKPLAILGIDEKFAHQVTEFIEQYRPALIKLAK